MTLAEIKKEIDALSPEQRKRLIAYLVAGDRFSDPEFRRELARRIDDKDPGHWISLEEAEKRLLSS
jgi:hypothetical protein